MQWTTTDQEQFIDLGNLTIQGSAASYGITKMDLVYTTGSSSIAPRAEAFPMPSLAVRIAAYCIKSANPLAVLSFMFRVIIDKLSNVYASLVMTDFAITEDVFNNVLSAEIRYVIFPSSSISIGALIAPITGVIGNPIASLPYWGGANPYPPFSQGTRTDSLIELAANNFAIACYTSVFGVGKDPTGQVIPSDAPVPPQQISNPPVNVVVYGGDLAPQASLWQIDFEVNRSLYGSNRTGYTLANIWTTRGGPSGVIGGAVVATAAAGGGPPTGSGGAVAVQANNQAPVTMTAIRAMSPMTKMIIHFVMHRINSPPELLQPDPNNQNYVLLHSEVTPQSPILFADGQSVIFKTTGYYEYLCKSPVGPDPGADQNLPITASPNIIFTGVLTPESAGPQKGDFVVKIGV
jgi:hypothetical protein